MSQVTAAETVRRGNPLLIPLVVVSIVAVMEALGLIVLVGVMAFRSVGTSHEEAAHHGAVAGGPSADTVDVAQGGGGERGFALGKKGERVESGGFGITVEKINYEPQYKNLADWGEDYRYLALLIVVENHSGGNASLLPATFKLQDEQGFQYQQRGLKLTEPKLDIRVLGSGEKIRGYLDFVVPKSTKGLKLVYWGVPTRNSQPIQVELGE